jgi:hypothetical protein
MLPRVSGSLVIEDVSQMFGKLAQLLKLVIYSNMVWRPTIAEI